MNEIIFPAIQLKLNINNVAFQIFGIDIYWYAIFIAVAIATGIFFCKRDDNKYDIKFDDILTLILLLIPICLVCARLYYVTFKLDYYINNPLQIFNFRGGGLAIYGGIISGAFVTYIYCKIKKLNFLDMLDYVVPYLALRTSNRTMGKFF